MRVRSKAEIKEFVENLWKGNYDNCEVRVGTAKGEDFVEITLSSMYSPPGLTFSKLKALSEFFETDNINDDDAFSSGGCETCDYGSSYGFTLTIRGNEE